MTDGFTGPDPASPGDDSDDPQDDDDPWANVKTEDELRAGAPEPEPDGEGGDTAPEEDSRESDESGFSDWLTQHVKQADYNLAEAAETVDVPLTAFADYATGDEVPSEPEQDRIKRKLDPPEPPTSLSDAAEALENDDNPDVAAWDEDPRGTFIGDDVSCANCEHRQVCIILSTFAPKLADENWDAGLEDEGSPIDPMDFAVICDAFTPEETDEAPHQRVSDSQ